MNPFLKEHAGPLLGSATLHLVLAGAVIAAALWTVTPRLNPPAAIDAYVARLPAPRAAPPPAPAPPAPPAAEPAPTPNLVADREREAAEAAARARHEEELRVTAAREAEATLKAKADAERRAAEQQAAAREAQRREAAATAARREAEETKRKLEEAKRKTEAEAAQRALQESDLVKQLAAEEHRLGAENSGLLDRYRSDLQARIERAWNRPPTARAGLKCTVFVTQVPGGTVTNVRLGECNGDAAVQQSITLAVYRASPLPAPADPSLFERNLQLVFEPHD